MALADKNPRTMSSGDVYSPDDGGGGGSGRTYAWTALAPFSTGRGALLDGTVAHPATIGAMIPATTVAVRAGDSRERRMPGLATRADLGGCALISCGPGGS